MDRAPQAYAVWLEVPDATVRVEVAGLDKGDAARRARWATIRERALSPGSVRVVGAIRLEDLGDLVAEIPPASAVTP